MDPAPLDRQRDADYIEGVSPTKKVPYSCSFVEFDEHGDYLKFQQHLDALAAIRSIQDADRTTPMLVVIYCHGWKNNADSDDVVRFNLFLSHLAENIPLVQKDPAKPMLRVHGVYIAWRGSSFPSYLDTGSPDYRSMLNQFGGQPIVNTHYTRSWEWTAWVPEQLSYWNRKSAAEYEVSGVPMARTIFECAYIAKRFDSMAKESKGDEDDRGLERVKSRVLLIGHSFGALMLEKSIGQACLGLTIAQWNLDKQTSYGTAEADPVLKLPFDFILFVNSAAPSLHTKLLSDLLWAHQVHMNADPNAATAPTIISVTSEGDWATGHMHRVANAFTFLQPSFQYQYRDGIFPDPKPGEEPPPEVQQSYYYERTPGNNPLLVEYWVEPMKDRTMTNTLYGGGTSQALSFSNWKWPNDPTAFFIGNKKDPTVPPAPWEIRPATDADNSWREYKGHVPQPKGAYWIVRCNADLISGHSDVWTDDAMELYIGLLRLTEWMKEPLSVRRQSPDAPPWLFHAR